MSRAARLGPGLGVLVLAPGLAALAGLAAGSTKDAFAALMGGGDAGAAMIVRDLRLPRTAIAILAGIALGVGGLPAQTFARNRSPITG